METQTPKEYAVKLYESFFYCIPSISDEGKLEDETAKKCAIIAVEEIIKQWDYIDTYLADYGGKFNPNLKYFLEVKQELEKL